jgi:hypothetical protein
MKALEEIMAKDRTIYLLPECVSIKINTLLASWKEEGKGCEIADKDIGKYQFLYWLEDDDWDADPRDLIISANSINEAIEKFIDNKPDDLAKVDYEVGFNGDYVNISDSALKQYI